MADGHCLLLAPLTPGERVVRFGFPAVSPGDPSIWCGEDPLEHHFTVE